MTIGEKLTGIIGTALFLAVLVVFADLPLDGAFFLALAVLGGAAVGLLARRKYDQAAVSDLADAAAAGKPPFEVGWQPQSGGRPLGRATTVFAGEPVWCTLYDLKQSTGLRVLKRLGLGLRLRIDDAQFERETFVERNREFGSALFASPARREAARAAFRLGFFAIEYRGGLVSVLRRGEVTRRLAAEVRPALAILAQA